MNEEAELVFVYGTLRVGASNHHRMKGAEWVGTGIVRGRLYQVSWYPGLVPEAGPRVVGDVYEVDADLLARLDEFEGIRPGTLEGTEYERRRITVEQAGATEVWDCLHPPEVEAWAWVWRRSVEDLEEVVGGDWLDVERPRQPSFYTGVGCVGLLGIPPVTGLLATVLSGRAPDPWPTLASALLVILAGSAGVMSGILAQRRREPGRPFQILLIAGAILVVFVGLMQLSLAF